MPKWLELGKKFYVCKCMREGYSREDGEKDKSRS